MGRISLRVQFICACWPRRMVDGVALILGDENHCLESYRARSRGGNCRPRCGGKCQVCIFSTQLTLSISLTRVAELFFVVVKQ